MATVKAKKAVSKKLKAGQKKKTNKWLLVGGIAAVVIIVAVVVRFSSASQWREIAHSSKSDPHVTTPFKYIAKGTRVRYCGRVATNIIKNSSVTVNLNYTYNPGSGYTTAVGHAGRRVSNTNTLACAETTVTTSAYWRAVFSVQTGRQNQKITGTSLSVLK